MKSPVDLFLVAVWPLLWAVSVYAAEATPKDGMVGIGTDEGEKSHLAFKVEKGAKIVKVSTHLKVDKVSPNGLNFFAIQVNYPNQTWAHGGPQANKKDNKLVRYANWGGLVNRGGGSKDYREADPKNDFALIECGIGKPNTVPWEWKLDTEYILTVERGKQIELPAGKYGPNHDVALGERTMWEWKFTIVPVDKANGGVEFVSMIHDSAEYLSSFYLWNEAGYGSKGSEQHARWSVPNYWTVGDEHPKPALGWSRF
jgi:hypothetical protein